MRWRLASLVGTHTSRQHSVHMFAHSQSSFLLGTRTSTIVTQEAVGPMADIHDRMPVEVPESWWERWLDPDLEDAQGALEDICAQSRTGVEAGSRDFHPVSTRVNAPVNEGADLITPV